MIRTLLDSSFMVACLWFWLAPSKAHAATHIAAADAQFGMLAAMVLGLLAAVVVGQVMGRKV